MQNAFDVANYPSIEPQTFQAGDRIVWKRSDLGAVYSNALYSLSYTARLEDGSFSVVLNATNSGSDYLIEIPSTTSSTYTSGTYHWSAYITRNSDSERIQVTSGQWGVTANKSSSTSDLRSHSKKVLDAIEATLEGRATQDQMSMTIAGKTLVNTPIEDLLVLRDRAKAEVLQETHAMRIAQGLPSRRKIRTRFV